MTDSERFTEDPELDAALRELARDDTSESSLVSGARVGHYVIVAPLGRGGMGVVYRARDTRLERDVAIKVLAPAVADNPVRRALLLREARAAASVVHPNVTTVFDVGEPAYIVMELVSGRSLRSVLADGPLPYRRALGHARQMADGLAAAHAAGIVHRDLKPENVVIDDRGLLKLLDFGLATSRSAAEEASAVGGRSGTLRYMSPEQAEGRAVDATTDVYAFGVVLVEMLTGAAPSASDDTTSRLGRVPAPVRALARSCLSHDPHARPRDGAEVVRRLRAATRRRPWKLAGLAIAVSLSAVAGGVWLRSRAGDVVPADRVPADDTPRVVQLTRNSVEAPVSLGALSPDGQLLAYAEERGVFVRPVTTPDPIAQFPGASNVAWLAGGRRLVMTVDGEYSIVSLDGSAPIRLGLRNAAATPSPDGQKLVFVRDHGLVLFDVETKRERELLRDEEMLNLETAWSPSGATIAWGRMMKDVAIGLYDVASGRHEVLVRHPRIRWSGGELGIAFSADDRLTFALAREAKEPASIQEITFDPTTLRARAPARQVARLEQAAATSLSVSRDGKRLAYVGRTPQVDIHIASLDVQARVLGALRRLTLSDADERPSSFSRDGRSLLAVVDTAEGFHRALALDTRSGLGPAVFHDAAWTTWSLPLSDGVLGLALEGRDAATNATTLSLVRADAEGKTVATRALGTATARWGARPPPHATTIGCSFDGTRCVLARDLPPSPGADPRDGFTTKVELVDPMTLERTQEKAVKGLSAFYGVALSSDGAMLAGTDGPNGRYVIFSIDGAPLRTLDVPPSCVAQFSTITPANDALVAAVACVDAPPYRVLWLPLDGRAPVTLATSSSTSYSYPVVSRDGKQLALAASSWGGNVFSVELAP